MCGYVPRVAGCEDLAETDASRPRVPAGQRWSSPQARPQPPASSVPLQAPHVASSGVGPWRVASERQAGTGAPASWAGAAGGAGGRRAAPAGIPEVTGSRGGRGGQQGCLRRLSGPRQCPHPCRALPPSRGLPQTHAALRLAPSRVHTGHIAERSGSSGAPASIADPVGEGVGPRERPLTPSPVCVSGSGPQRQAGQEARISHFRPHPLLWQLWAPMARSRRS